ncbi:MAG: OmpA family protein [Pseudorhodobacter sp.]|nr:OmpA family protein [Pseudorhodobacter sp.]
MMTLKTPIALSLAGMLVMTACAPTGQTRIDDPNYRAQNGAMTGAVIGGLLGAATRRGNGQDNLRSAAVGAVIGGLGGAAVGSVLDKQAADLRNNLGNPNVTVTNMGSYLLVNLPDDVLFATGSATVNSGLRSEISSIAANLMSYPNSTIKVLGHTDNVGTAAFNADLSQRRAISVADILSASGVPSSRITAIGMGEDRPVASNLTAEGRAQNRRVEILITPKN